MPGFSGFGGGPMGDLNDEDLIRQLAADLRGPAQPPSIPLARDVTPREQLAYYEGEPSLDMMGNPIYPQVYEWKQGVAYGGIPKHLRDKGKDFPAWHKRPNAPKNPQGGGPLVGLD